MSEDVVYLKEDELIKKKNAEVFPL